MTVTEKKAQAAPAKSDSEPATDPRVIVNELINRAKSAQNQFEYDDQSRLDEAVRALAWSIYKPENARDLAELAVETTGLGNVESKIIKNQRKTFGTLRDLLRAKSTGIIERIPERGLVKYAKPVGVVAAITPSTNPSATPVNKAMMAIKCGNPIIIAPSPSAWVATNQTVEGMREELAKIGAPRDLVQILPRPINRQVTTELMQQADLIVCTGSQNNVRGAYSSGTPAIGVGAGNVAVIVDTTADLADAAEKITMSKIFDNSTSCSSENAVILIDENFDAAIKALESAGGYLATKEEGTRINELLWQEGKLNRHLIAKDIDVLKSSFDLGTGRDDVKFIMVEETGIGRDFPLSGEKLSLVITVYRARDFNHAKEIATKIYDYQGKGHSVGLHTGEPEKAHELAREMDVVRVIVNQAHTFANGGSFENGLAFTLSMGCGTWQGNSLSDNLNYKCFMNISHVVETIPEDKPTEEELFGPHWEKYGK